MAHHKHSTLVQPDPPIERTREIPKGWNKGELLSQQNLGDRYRFSRAQPFRMPPSANFQDDTPEHIDFYNWEDAQDFISGWYMRVKVG